MRIEGPTDRHTLFYREARTAFKKKRGRKEKQDVKWEEKTEEEVED